MQQDLSFFNNLHSYASEKLKTVHSECIPILHIKRMNAQQAPPSQPQKQIMFVPRHTQSESCKDKDTCLHESKEIFSKCNKK
jgi:hypothetical protein